MIDEVFNSHSIKFYVRAIQRKVEIKNTQSLLLNA